MGRTPDSEGPPTMAMAGLLHGFQVARMIHVAAELGITDRIDDAPRPAEALALDCGAHPEMLLRLCRALAAFGVFTVDAEGRVGQSPLSATLRSDARPTLLHAARYWGSPSVWATWGQLEHTVRRGAPAFEACFGASYFAWLGSHPEEAERFDLFMRHSPDDQHRAVAAAYDFGDAATIVDVGGGDGALLAAVLTAFPAARGVLWDQAHVVAGAGAVLAAVRARCEIRSGDFFAEAPEGGDVYMLARILHDWSDARCGEILGACRRAMRPGARLLVIERLLGTGDAATDRMNHLSDMHMMALFPGARERTAAEYEALLAAAGFAGFQTIPTASAFHVMETRAA